MIPWYRTMGRTWTDLDSLESPRGSLSVDSIPGWSRASKNPEEDISPNTHRLLFAHEGPNGWVIGLRADVPHVQYNMDHTSTQGPTRQCRAICCHLPRRFRRYYS